VKAHTYLALSLVAAALAACNGHGEEGGEAAAAAPIRPVLTQVVVPSDTVMFGPFAGTIEPRYQAQLGFQIPGRMVARDVTIGDLVTRGQRLAALDTIVTRFDLTRAEADLADAKAQAENAEAAEARTRRLMSGNSVAQATLDQAVAKRETARARVDQALSSLQKARDQMGYTELKAEFDGVVTQRLAEVGQVLTAGQGVVTVARPDVREAVVDIPEVYVGALPADGIFTVALQSAPELTARGRVREIAPLAESGTRSKRIRISLDQPGPAFRLGAECLAHRAAAGIGTARGRRPPLGLGRVRRREVRVASRRDRSGGAGQRGGRSHRGRRWAEGRRTRRGRGGPCPQGRPGRAPGQRRRLIRPHGVFA
jgi:RND family efflux transporter MFP subunit